MTEPSDLELVAALEKDAYSTPVAGPNGVYAIYKPNSDVVAPDFKDEQQLSSTTSTSTMLTTSQHMLIQQSAMQQLRHRLTSQRLLKPATQQSSQSMQHPTISVVATILVVLATMTSMVILQRLQRTARLPENSSQLLRVMSQVLSQLKVLRTHT